MTPVQSVTRSGRLTLSLRPVSQQVLVLLYINYQLLTLSHAQPSNLILVLLLAYRNALDVKGRHFYIPPLT